jgi:glycosyltransferase involved in cell wall biosynthesis
MKILSLSNCPLSRDQGSGYVICGYADEMRAYGHTVELVGPESYVPFVALRPAWRLRKLIGYTLSALRRVRRHAPDVVELWGAEAWLATKLLARRRVRPLLVHRSNGIESHAAECMARLARASGPGGAGAGGRGRALGRWLDRLQDTEAAFTLCDAITTVGVFDRDYALRRGFQAADRLLSLENPLHADWLGRSWSPDRHEVVGFTGSWIERKGIAVLRAAAPAILAARPGARMLLVGVGERFRASVELPGVPADRIQVVGHARRKDLPGLYGYMSVLVQPSWYESFGLVAAEAMACGTPVVSTTVGFASGWTSGYEGWLVPFGDPGALAATVTRVLADAPARTEVAQRAWRRVQRLRWPEAAETLELSYKRWLSARAGAAG